MMNWFQDGVVFEDRPIFFTFLGKISTCFVWLDKFCSGVWAWCVDDIVAKLGSFKLVGFSCGYFVSTIVVRASK